MNLNLKKNERERKSANQPLFTIEQIKRFLFTHKWQRKLKMIVELLKEISGKNFARFLNLKLFY